MSGNKTIYWPKKHLYAIVRKRIKLVDLNLIIKEEKLWKPGEIFLRKRQQLLAGSV